MAALEAAAPATREEELPALDRRLLDLTVDQDTFEVLYRRRLQLAVPPSLDVRTSAEPEPPAEVPPRRISLGSAVGLALTALSLGDLLLAGWAAIDERRRRGNGRGLRRRTG